ncbi:MAG: DUF2892 domain-containing protein [Candidatus Micrarchaeia archaeon]
MFGLEVNEGTIDRAVRIIVGVLAAAVAFFRMVMPPLDLLLYVIAVVLIITGITGFCGLYRLLGINTLSKK